jgi:hypothetical protein
MVELAVIEAELSAAAERFDARELLGSQAAEVVRRATAIINAASTIRTLAAGRVAETPAWQRAGHRSPVDWLAAETKVSFSAAKGALETASKLEACPSVAAKARAGELSAAQTEVLANAVAVDPSAEQRLLVTAARDGFGKLKDQCRAVVLSGDDAEARHARLRRERSVRHWTDNEGGFRLAAKLTPEAGATVLGGAGPVRESRLRMCAAGGPPRTARGLPGRRPRRSGHHLTGR